MPLSTLIEFSERKVLGDILEDIFHTPSICRLSLETLGRTLENGATGAMYLAPLRSDLGDISRLLGCFVTFGDLSQPPTRFEIKKHTLTKISVAMEKPAHFTQPTVQKREMAEGPASFESRPSKVPYLRIVTPESDES